MLKFATVILRLRYIVPATAVGGYYTAKRKYEDFKSSLPEMPDFVKDFLDNSKDAIGSIDFDSWSQSLDDSRRTFNDWLEEANQAIRKKTEIPSMSNEAR